MVSENAIPLTAHEAAALEAFLRPGATVLDIARTLSLPLPETLNLLTSAPIAAALDSIRTLSQLQLEAVAEPCRASALAALRAIAGDPSASPTERRLAATALLRALHTPSRKREISGGATTRRATNLGSSPSIAAGSASSPSPRRERVPSEPRPTGSDRTTDDAAAHNDRDRAPALSPGGFKGGRAPIDCISSSAFPSHAPPTANSPRLPLPADWLSQAVADSLLVPPLPPLARRLPDTS